MSSLFFIYYEFDLHQRYRLQGQAWSIGRVHISAGSDRSLWSYMPLSGEKNDGCNFSQSPLMRYLSNLQVKRLGLSSNLSRIGLLTLKLFAFECRMFSPIDLFWRKWCIHLFSITLNSISIKLKVMRTGIKSQTSSNYSQNWSVILELGALEWWKNMMFIFNQIFKLACS